MGRRWCEARVGRGSYQRERKVRIAAALMIVPALCVTWRSKLASRSAATLHTPPSSSLSEVSLPLRLSWSLAFRCVGADSGSVSCQRTFYGHDKRQESEVFHELLDSGQNLRHLPHTHKTIQTHAQNENKHWAADERHIHGTRNTGPSTEFVNDWLKWVTRCD